MDCSLREASRKEQSIVPKKCISWTHQDEEKAKIPYTRVLLVFQKRLDFLQAKEWFFWCLLRPCILGTFCRFIPCNLSRLRRRKRVPSEAGSDPRGHLWVTWGVYLCAGKPLLADIILSHPPDLT